jgi:hypothetical protein
MYVLTAVAIFAVSAVLFGKFYNVEVLDYPFVVVLGALVAAGLSVLLRLSRMRRHKVAIRSNL